MFEISNNPQLKQAHFKNQSGIWINVTIPKLDVSTNYKVGYGFVGTSGSVKCNIQDLVITMLIRIPRGKSGHPSLDLPKCDASLKTFDMTVVEGHSLDHFFWRQHFLAPC